MAFCAPSDRGTNSARNWLVHGRRSARYVSLEGQDVSGAFRGSLTHRGRNASMWQSAHLPALPVVVPAGGGGRCLFHELRVDLSRHQVAAIAVMRSIELTEKWAVAVTARSRATAFTSGSTVSSGAPHPRSHGMATDKEERMARSSTSFKRGQKPMGGRPKGSLNRTTIEIREFARRLIEDPEYQAGLWQRVTEGKAPADGDAAFQVCLWAAGRAARGQRRGERGQV
jgi:hypothetical protein